MSGISSTSSATSSSLSNLSAVGQSLLTSGTVPTAGAATIANANANTISSYQAEFDTLQQDDTAELLYASFLSPSAGLANADAVLGQAAQLLDTPTLGSSQSTAASSSSTSSTASTSSTTDTDPLDSLPSISDILAASDEEAQQTLQAYSNAPAGSSIIDYQV